MLSLQRETDKVSEVYIIILNNIGIPFPKNAIPMLILNIHILLMWFDTRVCVKMPIDWLLWSNLRNPTLSFLANVPEFVFLIGQGADKKQFFLKINWNNRICYVFCTLQFSEFQIA